MSVPKTETGNGIIDENEFLQWVARIQALRDDPSTKASTILAGDDDDITQDLIAAFRCVSDRQPLRLNSHRKLCKYIFLYVFWIWVCRVFDRDGNGYITRDELQTAMEVIQENVTENQVSEMLALADLDKDGKINYEGKSQVFASFSILFRLVNRTVYEKVYARIINKFCSKYIANKSI